MRSSTQGQIRTHFHEISTGIFWPSDLSDYVVENRQRWGEFDLSAQQMVKHHQTLTVKLLLKEGLLLKTVFESPQYKPIVRYLRGKPSPYELAVSLRRDSFLCHRTALTLHGLEPPGTTIYVNKEQGSKPAPEGITQEGINRAFKGTQRQSSYTFRYGGSRFILISGKNTGKAGVVHSKGPHDEATDATDLERTLLDIVVRPAYAGGIKRVFSAFKQTASKINVDHMIGLLRRVNYAYPYHQSIGFLLYRAGRPERDCKKLKDFGLEFDFFLDYGLKRPAYDENWRLYYPSHLR
ncbi:MAG: hypothetical protein ACLQVL_13190 [Terriglobia bacterium]